MPSSGTARKPSNRSTEQSVQKESDDEERSQRAGGADAADKSGHAAKSPSDKLFKKMKRERLGATDARTVSLCVLAYQFPL